MKVKLLPLGIGTALLLLAGSVSNIRASEGYFELDNVRGDNARCYASSVLMTNQTYTILLSCRDILYPTGLDVFNYVVWANKSSDGKTFRLGTVGVGKAQFTSKQPFSSMFVTTEKSSKARSPGGTLVMQGRLQTFKFLEKRPSDSSFRPEDELGEREPTPEPIATPKPKSGIAKFIAAGGLAIFLGVFAMIALVFILTRQ